MRILSGAFACGLALSALAAQAQDASTIYRCTDADGAVSLQNGTPCPAGSKQEIRRVEVPPAAAAPPMPSSFTTVENTPYQPPPLEDFVQVAGPDDHLLAGPERPQSPAPARIAADERLPPPPIYRCEAWDKDSYISEDPAPKPRCVPLDTGGVGRACETRFDICARVGDNAACAGWKQRQREIESTWRHARGEEKPGLQEEFARVTKILQDTTCGL